ncbi:MAG TPA: PD-(D/E)XK nuclease family protein [Steroidobacteraceae bacterium]|nr:PD-(D/E)XK nuclease family protein [Steroidobacteraceae bacterium]
MSELYTASRLKVLRECLRKHLFKYVLRIRLPETDVMAFGTVGHKSLEAYYAEWKASGPSDKRLLAALDVIATSSLSAFDRVKLGLLVRAYDIRWGGEPWDVLAIEVEFRYELGGYLIGGKIDAIVRDQRDGRIWIVEHKTTGLDASYGSAYWEKLAIDTQVSVYIDGATVLGYEVAGCVYDVLKRPQHEQLRATPLDKQKFTDGKGCKTCGGSAKAGAVEQGRGYLIVNFGSVVEKPACADCKGTGWKCDAEGNPQAPRLHANLRATDETIEQFEQRVLEIVAASPDAFLLRGQVVRLESELPRMRDDLIEQIKIERAADLIGAAPRNPEACARYGKLCEFFDACVGRESIDNQLRYPRTDSAHPELVAAA